MAFIPVPDVVEAELIMELYGQRIENTLYFEKAGGWLPADMVELGEDLQVWWAAEYANIVTADVALLDVVVTDLSSAFAPSIGVPAPPGTVGGEAGASSPGNVCLTISFRTSGRGRSSRGRNYVSGIAEANIVGNDVTGSYATVASGVYSALLTPGTLPADVVWVVVSRFTAGAPRVTGLAQPILSAIITDNAIDSQRRRLRGRGD